LIAALVACFAARKYRAAAGAFLAVHLHFICDILGSRGASAEDIWGIAYFSPLAALPVFEWRGQWELVSWQNTLITLALLGWMFARGMRVGYTPLRLASKRADERVVHTLRRRFARRKEGRE
jgi:hypothetical protein